MKGFEALPNGGAGPHATRKAQAGAPHAEGLGPVPARNHDPY